jgi:hypothetical protein
MLNTRLGRARCDRRCVVAERDGQLNAFRPAFECEFGHTSLHELVFNELKPSN